MPNITTYIKDWEHCTDFRDVLVEWVDEAWGKLQYFKWEVSDWVFAILQFGSLEKHDEQSMKLINSVK